MARKIIAQNRKARHEYFIDEVLEAGIALSGTEVKSLRAGRASIAESYATEINKESHIAILRDHLAFDVLEFHLT